MIEESVLDGREALRALVRGWYIILVAAGLAGVAALGVTLLQDRSYSAQAQVQFDYAQKRINLQSNIQPANPTVNLDDVRDTQLALARGPNIAQAVVDQLGATLPDHLRDPQALSNVVRISASNETDLMTIQAVTETPDLAVAIANAWAQAITQQVTTSNGDLSEVAAVREQLTSAQRTYQQRQAELAQSPLILELAQLEQQTRDVQRVVDALQFAREQVISDTVLLETRQPFTDQWRDVNDQARLQEIVAALDFPEANTLDPDQPAIDQLIQMYQAVESRRSAKEAELETLTQEVDAAHSVVFSLTRRLSELQLTNALGDVSAEVISQSATASVLGRGTARNTLTGVIIGALLGIGYVLGCVLVARLVGPDRTQLRNDSTRIDQETARTA